MSYGVILAVLAVVVVALVGYMRKLTSREYDAIHIHDGEESQMADPVVLAKIDKLGKILAAVTVAANIVLFAAWIYFEQIADSGVGMGCEARVVQP